MLFKFIINYSTPANCFRNEILAFFQLLQVFSKLYIYIKQDKLYNDHYIILCSQKYNKLILEFLVCYI